VIRAARGLFRPRWIQTASADGLLRVLMRISGVEPLPFNLCLVLTAGCASSQIGVPIFRWRLISAQTLLLSSSGSYACAAG